ncbi:MAG: hypothetical protein WCI46_04915 [Verrucomicrobiota bacterium]
MSKQPLKETWALQVADRGWFGQRLSQERGRFRPHQSSESQTGGGGRALERFCVEQLAGVSGGPGKASGVVAGGSVAGRVGHSQRQSGGAATAGAGLGGTARGGGRRGVPADLARLVSEARSSFGRSC